MTASASVVEALRRITEIYVGAPVNTEEANAYAGALHEAQDLANEALSALTPHPAEQDAREAVALLLRDLERGRDKRDEGDPVRAEFEAHIRTVQALTQAAPDGWRLVPVEPTHEMIEAGYQPWLNRGNRKGPSVVRGVYLAMLSASPAPPAQGAGS